MNRGEEECMNVSGSIVRGKEITRTAKMWVTDNIMMDLEKIGRCGKDCQAQVRDKWRALVNVVMNLWVP
jgi:hypothetical protein